MADFHPSTKDKMSFHALLPGYNYSLQDPSDAFYSRQIVSFQAQQNSYEPRVQAQLSLSNNEAFLDVDNSYFQCILTFSQQFAANTTEFSQNAAWVLDQYASSIVDRLVIKAGGQTLSDHQFFSDYHHTKMLTEDDQCEQMASFSEDTAVFPSLQLEGANVAALITSSANYAPANLYNTQQIGALQLLFGQQASGAIGGTTYYNDLNGCIRERMIEDVKRQSKFYQLSTAVTENPLQNLNMGYAPRSNNTSDMNNYLVLLKLSDLPCFSSKQYFPLFAVNGPIQFQFTWKPPVNCMHRQGFAAGAALADTAPIAAFANPLSYTVYNLELICSLIYPKPDFVDRYMLDVVAGNEGFYKCEYIDASLLGLPSSNSTLLYNVSLARLTKSIYLKKELLQDVIGDVADQEASSKRYSQTDLYNNGSVAIGGFNYRGNKWYSPWGDISQIFTRVNGITYPNANSSVLINEHLIKEQTEEVLGKLIGLRDPRRFFFDQQVLAFSYKKDTHSSQLQDVSGINTSNNNQISLTVNLKNVPAQNTQILGIHYGEMVLQFTPSGSLLLFR